MRWAGQVWGYVAFCSAASIACSRSCDVKSKQGKSFDAVVAFDGEYNTTFVFPEAKKGKKFSGRKK